MGSLGLSVSLARLEWRNRHGRTHSDCRVDQENQNRLVIPVLGDLSDLSAAVGDGHQPFPTYSENTPISAGIQPPGALFATLPFGMGKTGTNVFLKNQYLGSNPGSLPHRLTLPIEFQRNDMGATAGISVERRPRPTPFGQHFPH